MIGPFALADAKEVQRLADEKAIAAQTASMPHPYWGVMAEQWIATHQACFEAGERIRFAIVLQDAGILIGAISLLTIAPAGTMLAALTTYRIWVEHWRFLNRRLR